MNSQVSETSVVGEHQVTLNLSILQAVESSGKVTYRDSVRDGERKRIYESPVPSHHFHIEYRLLPGKNAQVFKTDVVTFGNVVAKVYTDRDNRVVQCWTEEEEEVKLSHYGWKHKHTFKVNKDQLLAIYNHVLEVRVWNTKSKLSPKAKYDRPKAFRVPVKRINSKGEAGTDLDSKDVPGIIQRPSKFSVVYHDQVRKMKMNRRMSGKLATTLQTQTLMPTERLGVNMNPDETGGSIEQMHSFNVEGQMKPEGSSKTIAEGVEATSGAPVPASSGVSQPLSLETQGAATQEFNRQVQAIYRRTQKRLEAEAAEEAMIEKEGIAVVRINFLDLFGKHGCTQNKLGSPVKDLKVFEVSVSVADSLLTDELSKELNPMTITVLKATGLPSKPLTYDQLQQWCDPAFVRYQFHTQAPHCTGGVPQAGEAGWNDSHIHLLGTIDRQLLVEYLRGPPLVLELHDRSRRAEDRTLPALFGEEIRDDVLGTHAFTAGVPHSTPSAALHGERPWSPYGVAKLDLSGLLQGHRVLELTVPVTNGPRCSLEQHEASLSNPLPPGDYIGSHCQLKVLVEVSHPLCLSPVLNVESSTKTKFVHDRCDSKATLKCLSADGRRSTMPELNRLTSKSRLTTSLQRRASKVSVIDKRASRTTVELISESTSEHIANVKPDTCPFNRVIYTVSSAGNSIVHQLITNVNEVNAKALGLENLSGDVLPAALSTYKLTKEQMTSGECNVITGFHMEDSEHHVIVLEGLKTRGLKKIWEESPHHTTKDEAIMKVLYNSEFEFSKRLYAVLDVDLPKIRLYHSLSYLTRQPLLYIKDSIPEKCFRALMILDELCCVSEMSDVTRNNLFPSPEEVTALSLQLALPATAGLSDNGNAPVDHSATAVSIQAHTPHEWVPLKLTNPQFEKHLIERHNLPAVDFVATNKLHVQTLSEAANSRKLHHPSRQRSLSEATPVHNYSSQTYNSVRLAKAKLRERLASDPHHRYTYCQHYHSMTVVPVDTEVEKKEQAQEEREKWRTNEAFVYPRVPSARSSNTHSKVPHPSRVESLQEAFEDNLLHANSLKPTVERVQFNWESRNKDFERWRRPPPVLGPPLPLTIHLAGESSTRELQERLDLEQTEWNNKLVVSNPHFQPYRRGVQTELTKSGPKASTQLDKVSGLLKDSPKKHSLKQAGLTVHDIPALDVLHIPRMVNPLSPCKDQPKDDLCKKGYVPGPAISRSLTLSSNVIPLTSYPHNNLFDGMLEHSQNFRLYYHIPTPPAGAMAGVTTEGH